MKPRITLLTIGVDDLERSLAFYRDGLGLPTRGIIGTEFEHGAVAFFDLDGGLKLALYEERHRARGQGTCRPPQRDGVHDRPQRAQQGRGGLGHGRSAEGWRDDH